MIKVIPGIIIIILINFSCMSDMKKDSIENWKKEIIESEKEFAEMALNVGIPEAFLAYAARDAVLMRDNSLIVGFDAIRKSYENKKTDHSKVRLTWEPDFVDVSSSGDLGYTYGKYVYTAIDSNGVEHVTKGIFHTVWKRQPNGKWKYVWD